MLFCVFTCLPYAQIFSALVSQSIFRLESDFKFRCCIEQLKLQVLSSDLRVCAGNGKTNYSEPYGVKDSRI
jgi:hypothetical protein